MEEAPNVNELIIFKKSGEKFSQKFFRSVEKSNKIEYSKTVLSIICFDFLRVQSFLRFFIFLLYNAVTYTINIPLMNTHSVLPKTYLKH